MLANLNVIGSARLIAGIGVFLTVTAGLFGSIQQASAQDVVGVIFGYEDRAAEQSKQHHIRRPQRSRAPLSDDRAQDSTATKQGKEEAKQAPPQGAVYAIVSIADQHVTVYDATGRIAQSRISSGMPGHPTPMGLFTIIGKERWHRSNIYSGAPMPFMQRITWSGVAMHLGVVPGYPASHGCIRLPEEFAQQFWGMTQIGSRVVIARNDTTPVEISSPFLPVPKLQPASKLLPVSEQSSPPASGPVKLASFGEASPISASTAGEALPSPAAASKLLNPIEYAKALKEYALASEAASAKATKEALLAAKAAEGVARQAFEDISVQPPASLPIEAPIPLGVDISAKAALASSVGAAHVDIERAHAALMEAHARDAAKGQAAIAAMQTWKDAVATEKLAADAVKEAERRLKPVSVLFSKKEGRVFIRQDSQEIYEGPITFKEPDRPIGTHLFIAVSGDADGKVSWSAISVPSKATPSEEPSHKRSKKQESAADVVPAPTPPSDTASAALSRIEAEDDVRERIADLVWVGAQVIVTDNARSDEMDSDTDIIVSTR